MKKYLAELVGTFVLVFIGCGSAVIAGDPVGFLGIAFAFGISVLAMVYAIGPISGCHINPAITVSMLVAGKMNTKDAIGYVIFQIIGAILGSGALFLIASGLAGYDLAINGLGENGFGEGSPMGYDMQSAFIAEVLLTAVFLVVVFGATHKKANVKFAGLAIGLALTMIHIVGIPITGTSVNPARSIGPALFVQGLALSQLWLFVVAPLLGGILGALIWKGMKVEG
ncbi:aquaporin Z [Flavobacteriaceae bacterium F08102]|nr:aquaporin Z [Flavobacteriaceae bacterium F08102]